MNSSSERTYISTITDVREVALAGTADLAYWRERLRGEGLAPLDDDGRASLLLTAIESKFRGIPFRELSISVLLPGGGAFLAHAFNSSRLLAFAERMDMQDLRFLAVSVTIQAQSGGNLAEILDGLSKVVRARFKLFRRVRAITAEAKWSGMFLSGFPIGAMLMISIVKPDYYDEVKETPLFIPVALVVVAFLVVNVLYMRKMVNIQV